MNETRYTIAVATSPLIPVAIVLIPLLQGGNFQFNMLIIGITLLISYIAFFAIGTPLISLLKHIGLLNLPALAIAGAIIGMLVFVLFIHLLGVVLGLSTSNLFPTAFWGAVPGLCTAIYFWLIAGITRQST